ncbi:hypothetical protein [Clostridium sp.]|jgi:hypothetical protein|uniref:hypothetical protein n=1 Tax=Clostridium sp. TaxID=1506 RepID=UPI003EE8A349
MKKLQAIVKNNKDGDVVTMRNITDPNTGETREIGNVMVQSVSYTGFSKVARLSKRTAFIALEADLLAILIEDINDGQAFPIDGKIVINETVTPYIKKNGDTQDPKTRGAGGAVMTFNGQPIYRNSFFSENLDEKDLLLKADPEAQDDMEESDFDSPE